MPRPGLEDASTRLPVAQLRKASLCRSARDRFTRSDKPNSNSDRHTRPSASNHAQAQCQQSCPGLPEASNHAQTQASNHAKAGPAIRCDAMLLAEPREELPPAHEALQKALHVKEMPKRKQCSSSRKGKRNRSTRPLLEGLGVVAIHVRHGWGASPPGSVEGDRASWCLQCQPAAGTASWVCLQHFWAPLSRGTSDGTSGCDSRCCFSCSCERVLPR